MFQRIFPHIFFCLIRVFIVPAAAILALSNSFMGPQVAFLGVNIVNSILTVPMMVFHLFEIIPNLAFLRTHHIVKLLISIILELIGLVGFWVFYFSMYK